MFRAEDLEVIRANLEAPENSYAYEEYKKLVATECDGVIKGELSYDEIGKILTTIESDCGTVGDSTCRAERRSGRRLRRDKRDRERDADRDI